MPKKIAIYGTIQARVPVFQRYWKRRKDGIKQRYWKKTTQTKNSFSPQDTNSQAKAKTSTKQ